MTHNVAVQEWLEQIRAGDHTGAQRIWDSFSHQMTVVARTRMRYWAHRVAADEEDIVQVAFAAFCQRIRQGEYAHLGDRAEVARVLKSMVTRSAVRMFRDGTCLKRGGGKVTRELSSNAQDTPLRGARAFTQIAAVGLDPTQHSEGTEQFLILLDKLALSEHRLWRIALWKMNGFTNEEIASRLECGLATVERRLAKIRLILVDYLPGESR